MKKFLSIFLILISSSAAIAQTPVYIHSHNDYKRETPFFEAYSQKVFSIEADSFFIDGQFLVGHEIEDLDVSSTLDGLYLWPAVDLFRRNGGHPYADPALKLQLIVEIKSSTEPFLSEFVRLVEEKYPDVFCNGGIRTVITGNVPSPEDFGKYPAWIWFDGMLRTTYTPAQLERVALFSECFTDYVDWNGNDPLSPQQRGTLKELVGKAHSLGKPIRFWGAPESLTVYRTFLGLGIDYMNTDHPEQCVSFYSMDGEEKGDASYKNTYVKEVFVTENGFRTQKPSEIIPASFEDARRILPSPVWNGHKDEIDMYWDAWRIAVSNIRQPQEGSGFVSPYLDVAYNGNIFMWDSCFMMMFARYGYRYFPFQKSLDNFYAKQHPDGFICREIRSDGSDCFERYDPVSTGPDLLPWAELAYYRQFGDLERLHAVFPVLCAYARWWHLNRTWPNGTYWSSGWGTGMDNMPRVKSGYSPIYSNGHMEWLDANIQQILVNECLLRIGFETERWQEIEDLEDEIKFLKKHIAENMWSEVDGFLHDRYADGTLCDTKGISAFWALQTDILDKDKLDRLVSHLSDESEFGRTHMVPSLSADHPKYKSDGRYWQGGVWPGTNYMVIDGLWNKGYRKEARTVAANHYDSVFKVWKNTGTFWEYYAPESVNPGFMARKNFVGWTGLPPIAVFLEYVLGIKSDYSEESIEWDVTKLEKHGIERYPFGPDAVVSLICEKRSSASEKPRITVDTDVPFNLTVLWGDGQSSTVRVEKKGRVTL